jgi:hypothetical protein
MTVLRSTWRLWLYLLASLAAFLLVALPVLRREMHLQFYADTPTYERLARTMPLSFDLIQVGANLFGPVLILKTLGGDRFLVYLFNVACLTAAFAIVVRTFPVNRLQFLFYLTLTPLVFTSLLSINKEIVAVAATAFFAAYYQSGRRWQLVVGLVASFLVRWQMTLFMLVFIAMASPINPVRRRRLLSIVLLTLAISVAYVHNLDTFQRIDQVASLAGRQEVEGSGLYGVFLSVQNAYGYVLVFLPKTLHQMIGPLARLDNVTQVQDFFNNDVILFHSVATLGLLLLALWRRRIRLDLDPIYMAVVYAAVFGLSPIFAPRYFLPIYVLVAIALSLRLAPQVAAKVDRERPAALVPAAR